LTRAVELTFSADVSGFSSAVTTKQNENKHGMMTTISMLKLQCKSILFQNAMWIKQNNYRYPRLKTIMKPSIKKDKKNKTNSLKSKM